MLYTVVNQKFVNGVRRSVLLEKGFPAYYPTLYVSRKMKNNSANRQRNFNNSIKVFFEWLMYENIDIEKRFIDNQPLTKIEIFRLLDYLIWDAGTRYNLIKKVRMLTSAYKQIKKETYITRTLDVKNYISFLYLELATAKNKMEIEIEISKNIESYRPKIKRYSRNSVRAITDEQLNILFEKIMPENKENPWYDSSVQIRNLLIVNLLYETGLRKGELAGLYVSDINISENTISIYRRQNNKLEKRIDAPSVKTGERTIPIPDDLVSIIDLYILKHRSKIKEAKKHPYLLISHKRNKGKPMTLKSIAEVFVRLHKIFPELKGISAHDFRHNMNYRISKMIDENFADKTPEDKSVIDEQVRPHIMGHSPNSKMQQVYNKRYNIEEANKIMKERVSRYNKDEEYDS